MACIWPMRWRLFQKRRQQATAVHANLCHRAVWAIKQPVVEQERRPVSQQSVPLHLSEADSSLNVPPSQWLIGHFISRSSGSDLELVRDHVPQALVVNHPDEDVCLELQAAYARVEALRAIVVVPCGFQHFTEMLERRALLRELERCGVMTQAVEGCRFSSHALDEHPDGHSGGEAVRVEQDVRAHAALSEGHVLRGPQSAQDSLLTVSAGELVSDGGVSGNAGCEANALEATSAGVIAAHLDVVNHTALLIPEEIQRCRNQWNLKKHSCTKHKNIKTSRYK